MIKFFFVFLLFTSFSVQGQSMSEPLEDTTDILIGEVDGYTLMYDCHDCRQSVSGSITINYKTKKSKRRLLDQVIFDFYVDDVAILKMHGENFIYIGSTHTYGHSQGYLYYLNTRTMKAYEVVKERAVHKFPDSIQYHKYFDLTRDKKNNLGSSATIRDDSGRRGFISGSYTLKKLKPNHYVLVASKPVWGMDD